MQLIQKRYSLNPDEYKWITEEKAKSLYKDYLRACLSSDYADVTTVKNYQEWLATEI